MSNFTYTQTPSPTSWARGITTPLTNITCLITRPTHQTQHLRELIQHAGGRCLLFPTIEIVPLPLNIQHINQALESAQKIIFTSANAAPPVAAHLSSCQNISIFCTGSGTQKALRQYHIEANIPEAGEFNSEGLLNLAALQSVKNQNIIIFSGKNSRTLLQETLRKRGAQVTQIPVYQRIKPNVDISILKHEKINWMISTSQESLKNLWEMAGETHQSWLTKQHLLVISPGMKTLAEQLGFLHPAMVSANASDEAIFNTLSDKQTEP